MARPSVAHGGFIIPNAGDVSEPILAEPDKIDFNTVANARWGVISGCLVTAQSGGVVSVQDGTAVVNGQFVLVKAATLPITSATGPPRFDLVVTDNSGNPSVLVGTQSSNPVMRDVLPTQTLLAVILCVSGKAATDFVVDKRKFLAPNLLTQVGIEDDLLRNFNAPGAAPTDPVLNYYRVLGSGETIWLNDARLKRTGAASLGIEDNLDVKTALSAGTLASRGTLTVAGNLTAKNFRRSVGTPPNPGTIGDLWQDPDTGKLSIFKKISGLDQWDEVTSISSILPTGSILQSLETPTRMSPLGWLALDGNVVVDETAYPNLFKVAALLAYAQGTAPNRKLYLPNLSRRVLMTDHANAGKYGPNRAKGTNPNTIKLTVAQMPQHGHKALGAGGFTPKGEITGSPATTGYHTHPAAGLVHSHPYTDPGHGHDVSVATLVGATVTNGAGTSSTAVFTPNATGRTKIKSDEALIAVTVGNPSPALKADGAPHDHPITFSPVPAHEHNTDLAGSGAGIDITPDYFTVYTYVKG